VEGLKKRHDFEISVATYPQKHPDSGRIQDDIRALHKKQDAGATSAITQVVFNPNAYFRFRDECVKQGITIPIIPGILPVTDYAQTKRFLSRCGGTMPLSITLEVNKCASPDDHIKKGEDLLIRHLERYVKEGLPHLHFYTLNRKQPLLKILPQFL
jgi:methylenetetrahydrofolate reductase (NADPH)